MRHRSGVIANGEALLLQLPSGHFFFCCCSRSFEADVTCQTHEQPQPQSQLQPQPELQQGVGESEWRRKCSKGVRAAAQMLDRLALLEPSPGLQATRGWRRKG